MENYIWTLWWQGESNAPSIVRKCLDSMRRHSNGARLVVLDKNSVQKYIMIPRHISDKFENGCMSITHLSDIIRFQLLYQYGGLWLDSTIYVKTDIPACIFDQELYTLKTGTERNERNIARGRWTAFLMGGRQNNILFASMNKMFDSYWKLYDSLLCYFLVDYCINSSYDRIEEVRDLIDHMEEYGGNVFSMCQSIHSENDVSDAMAEGIFNKLNWKTPWMDRRAIGRLNSLGRHICGLLDNYMTERLGFKFTFYTFLIRCMRTSQSKSGIRISEKYHRLVKERLISTIEG